MSCSRRRCGSCSSTRSRCSPWPARTIRPWWWATWSAPPFSARGSSSRATSTREKQAGSGGCAERRASAGLAVARPGRRLGGAPPMLLEPAHHVKLRAHEVGRLRSRAVVLVVEAQHHGRYTAHLKGSVDLLGLRA